MIIDVYSDIACPWCYVGERTLGKALAMRPDLEVEMRWRPYQLRPELHKEGLNWAEFVQTKWGSFERANEIFAHVTEAGAAQGIKFDFYNMATTPNTLDAHRLALFARQYKLEWDTVNALYAAHFEQGRDVGNREVLVTVASEAGLDAEEARAYLASNAGIAEVEASQHLASLAGIEGVPFYIIDGRQSLSGAQPVQIFLEALDRAAVPA